MPDSPYPREPGYALRYRDQRFRTGHGPGTHRAEQRALRALLAGCGAGPGPWLDVPSGAGRMSGLLPGKVVQVDRDVAMLWTSPVPGPRACASATALPFAARSFAGVLCCRLLQHIGGADERRRILAELARTSRGPVIVTFFDAHSLQHLRRLVRRRLGKKHSGRSALTRAALRRDAAAAGLVPVRFLALRRLLGEQTFVLLRHAGAAAGR